MVYPPSRWSRITVLPSFPQSLRAVSTTLPLATAKTGSPRGLAPILQQPVDDGTAVAHIRVGPVHSCWAISLNSGLDRSPGLDGSAWTAAYGRRRDWPLPHNRRRWKRVGDCRSKPFHDCCFLDGA